MKQYEHGYKCSRDPLVTEHEDTKKNKKKETGGYRGDSRVLYKMSKASTLSFKKTQDL